MERGRVLKRSSIVLRLFGRHRDVIGTSFGKRQMTTGARSAAIVHRDAIGGTSKQLLGPSFYATK